MDGPAGFKIIYLYCFHKRKFFTEVEKNRSLDITRKF